MNTFRYASDLHGNVLVHQSTNSEEILLLAGDVTEFGGKGSKINSILHALCTQFKHVVMVLGNHEYYGNSLLTVKPKIEALLSDVDNFTILQCGSYIDFDNTRVIGATLWSDTTDIAVRITDIMNDYKCIKIVDKSQGIGYKRFTPKLSTQIHRDHVEALNREISKAKALGMTTITMTHHAPSWKSVPNKYKQDWISKAFATDIELDNWGDYWIHGHTHEASTYHHNGCKVICNPLGHFHENTGFVPYLNTLKLL